jgi:hypothetical protein
MTFLLGGDITIRRDLLADNPKIRIPCLDCSLDFDQTDIAQAKLLGWSCAETGGAFAVITLLDGNDLHRIHNIDIEEI